MLGGYAAESEAAALSASLGLPQKVLKQPLHTLSGGQRRRVELARILFGGSRHAAAGRADQPPGRRLGELAARSPALLPRRPGGHQPRHRPAGRVVNKVFHLDADRSTLDIYNLGWKAYLDQRETDARRRRRERVNAERQAAALQLPGRQDAGQGDQGQGRAEHGQARGEAARRGQRRPARRTGSPGCASPSPAHCGRTPLTAPGADQVLRLAGGIHRRRHGGRPGRTGGRARAERRRARPRCCGCWPESSSRIPARCCPGTGCGSATTPRSTRPWTTSAPCWRTCASAAPGPDRGRAARHPGLVPVLRRRRGQAGRRAVRRREDQAGAGAAGRVRARTCCCSTSRRTTSTPAAGPRSCPRCAASGRDRAGHAR